MSFSGTKNRKIMMDLRYIFYIDGSPEEVWKAIVSPEGTKQIYYGSVIESTFDVGRPLKYVGPEVGGDETIHIYGEVLAFEPHEVFRFTHNVGEAYGAEHAEYESRISYHLEAVGACTQLTLVHDEWTEGDPSHESSAALWPRILSNTKTLVETGQTLDLE